MNRKSGSVLTLVMTCLLAGAAGHSMAAEAGDYGVFDAIAGENGTTYENFFDVTLAEENYVWKIRYRISIGRMAIRAPAIICG